MRPLLAILFFASLVGCASGAPPTAFERAAYEVTTQHVEVVTMHTNYVGTNIVAVVPVTNIAEVELLIPRASVKAGIKAGGTVATGFGFGLGGIIAIVIGGLYAGWAEWRNSTKGKLNAVLVQTVETGREIIKTTPQGVQLEENYKEWLKQNQRVAGVIALAGSVVEESVDNAAAKAAAELLTRPARSQNGH